MVDLLNMAGIKTATAGEWLTKGDAADIGVPLMRTSDVETLLLSLDDSSGSTIWKLRKFLNSAAGEGFELDGVDAADLFIEIFGAPK